VSCVCVWSVSVSVSMSMSVSASVTMSVLQKRVSFAKTDVYKSGSLQKKSHYL